MTLLQSEKTNINFDHLASYYDLLMKHDDAKNANKLVELYEKLMNENLFISFTGHFSAGKSSMINHLLNQNILPKSPIPTSGNIVEITSGEGFARIFFNDDTSVLYEEPYDINVIQAFCKDNQNVKKVILNTSEPILPKGCMIVDTPGIDAADDADRLMTESSLHLVDYLFYVMDYNHVQSEVNLYFLTQIQSQGIPFCIIINQVDKHNDQEIPFEYFTQRINQTFDQWNLKPEKVFYSSLIDKENKYNEFDDIHQFLETLLTKRQDVHLSIERSVGKIIHDHKSFLNAVYEEKLVDIPTTHNEVDLSTYEDTKEKLATLKQLPVNCKKAFQNALNQTLKNAYLMPATLRDHATLFLESQQKDFRVGLFRARQKTTEEKELRLTNFLKPLQKNIEATIQWNFRDKVIALLHNYQLDQPELIQFTKQLSIDYTAEDLIALMKHGAQLNGEYILNYTNDVRAHIKDTYKNQAWLLWEKIESNITKQTNESIETYVKHLQVLEHASSQSKQQKQLQTELEDKYGLLDHLFNHPTLDQANKQQIEQMIQLKQQTVEKAKHPQLIAEKQYPSAVDVEEHTSATYKQQSTEDVIQAVHQTIETIEELPGFQTLIEDLQLQKNKLLDRSITIALFGAFSAGKSSFANALLGKSLLPSSPNPTTAVINKISPVTAHAKHETVTIEVKNEKTLLQDLLTITKELSPPQNDLDGLIDWIKIERIDQSIMLDKVYQAYLHAVLQGYPAMKQYLGQSITITINDFVDYITNETKACFIDVVTLYYDCSLTRLGITLVDTPGADSINARHTNVAFDYIKQADAILYVMYYNHALSRADRDFLIQLGRVKDAFQLDKMFFIINAADLAESKTDLELVINYVTDQLLQFGIRLPKVFPVSSKRSLEDKLNNQPLNEQLTLFEEKFYQFINEDLVALSIQSTLWDIKRAHQDITHYIQTAYFNEQEKDEFKRTLHQKGKLLQQTIAEAEAHTYEERIIQRIERQLHYATERLSIRFHDLFKDRFNPTTVTESGKRGITQLESNLRQLIDDTGYELLQELRAISLRIEAQLNNLNTEVYQDFQTRAQKIDKHFSLPMVEMKQLKTPQYEQAFLKLDLQPFQKVLKKFKGTKDFFEKNSKDVMRDNLYQEISPSMKQYIENNQQTMVKSYVDQWQQLFKNNKQQVSNIINHFIENNLEMMQTKIDLQTLEEKEQVLASLIEISHIEG